MDSSKTTLRWLTGVFYRNNGAPCVKLALRHAGKKGDGTGGHLIQEWEIDGKIDDDLIAQLESEIKQCARDDAEGVGGRQRYIVFAYRDVGSDPYTRHPFPMTGTDSAGGDFDPDSFESEGATPNGIIAQQMRHNEVMMRALVGNTATMMNVQQRQIARLGDMVENLLGDKIKSIELQEEMLDRKHEREIELKQLEGRTRLRDEAIEAFKLLVPIAANKMIGGKVLPEKDPTFVMLKNLAESLAPQQVQALLTVLKPEQQAVLLEFMQMTQRDEKPAGS